MSLKQVWEGAVKTRERFGWQAASLHLLHYVVNRVVFFDCLEVIELDRQQVRPLPEGPGDHFDAHLASREELLAMRDAGHWDINEEKLRLFDAGDHCVLSLVNGQVAGYTWVHAQGQPTLIPGLTLRLPKRYLYNYAGFTLPSFRGAGLQSLRHHSVLNQAAWADRSALLGYVRYVNYPSKKGQAKSGYRKLGAIWMLGGHDHFITWTSGAVRRLGISRVHPHQLPSAPSTDNAAHIDVHASGA